MKSKLLLITLLLVAMGTISAQKLTQTFKFSPPEFIEKHDGFVEPQIEGCLNYGDEGNPITPLYSAEILLPQGTEITNISILSVKYTDEYHNINIVPAGRQFPISRPAPSGYKPEANADIYNADAAFPGKIIQSFSTQFMGAYSIAVIGINTMEFYPGLHAARYLGEISIEIETEKIQNPKVREAHYNRFTEQRVANIVENPGMISEYYFEPLRNEDVDLLLITKNDYVDVFQTYVDFKTERGFAVQVEKVEDIYENYSGEDDQEKIRNCIIDYYENHGITYVILGGDADPNNASSRIVPHRGFYVNTGFGEIDDDIPSDMYYCCLDGSWDNNNNGNFGEPGEEDLFAEVLIGRMCVDSPTDIANMSNKLIKYQDAPVVQDIEKALMVGEALDESTWGGDSKDDVAYGSSNFGYTTVGLSENFVISKLYEKLGNWNKSNVFNQFNNVGCNLLNHLGHSSTTYNMKMYNSDLTISNFQNDGISRGFVIGYSQGCYNGAFDNRGTGTSYGADCFSENFTTMATGEVATLGNSRYGWYSSGNTNGASQYLDRQFYDAIFDEDMTQIGAANSDSREDNAAYILNNQVIRWCAYEITLFGDPTMDIWTAQPTDIAVNHPAALPIGTGEISINTDAPFARIGLMQNGALIGRGVAGESGDMIVDFFNPITTNELIDIYITAHNRNVYTETIAVVSDQPYVIFNSIEINDEQGNNNGVADFGETVQLTVSLKNVGNQPANNVMVALASADTNIYIPFFLMDFGNFAAGEVKTIENAFEAEIAPDVPDQHDFEITVSATGQENWISDFEILACAPKIEITEVWIDDSQGGNGNTLLDPGENAIIGFSIINVGHSLSPDLNMNISSLNENVTVVAGEQSHSALSINESTNLNFEIHVSEDAGMGDLALIQAVVNSGWYQVIENYSFDIGMIVETFESGDFSGLDWEFSGNADWEICTDDPWEGSFCVRSGEIGHNSSSELLLDVMIVATSPISFYRKVSSESGYDYLKFYVDNTLKGQWAGEEAWQEANFPIPAGMHTLRWVYEKDQGVASGDDCAWIDFIKFPPLAQASINTGGDAAICQGQTFLPDASGLFVNGIHWETAGDGTFNNANMLKPTYTPGIQDKQNGQVQLLVTANGMNGGTYSDEMTLYIQNWPQTPEMPQGETLACTNYGLTYEYSINDAGFNYEYIWELLPEEAGTIEGNSSTAFINWTPAYEGAVELRVKLANACGSGNFSAALEIQAEICTGIGEPDEEAFRIFPNPSNGLFSLEIPNGTEAFDLSIYNAFGQQVMDEKIRNCISFIPVDLASQPKGIYFIRIETLEGNYLRKIVVK
ncbi:MAG: T9SS type A sorting domain-containing protein [Bacteroidales bacterium]|nr:T9SS type A sorting domain-containing protein [Bacteroidales bacterium]